MRVFALLPALLPLLLTAQPGLPDLTMVFVRDEAGHAQRGAYANTVAEQEWTGTRRRPAWTVELHFTVNTDYPYSPHEVGTHQFWPLGPDTVRDGRREHLRFHLSDCWCVDQYLRVVQGAEVMRIDLPNAPAERWTLVQHVMARSGYSASPEVIRFRPGRFTYVELMNDADFDALEARLAEQLKRTDEEAYQQQLAEQEEYYRNLPPSAPPTAPYIPPPPMTEEQWAAELARQPGLPKVELVYVNGDTVQLSITGRVMLDGGCASGMPLFGVESLTDIGWVYRFPFDLTQMDCGMPWADWTDQLVKVPPLRWYAAAHQPEGKRELWPGRYRLVFVGGNGKEVRTQPFTLE